MSLILSSCKNDAEGTTLKSVTVIENSSLQVPLNVPQKIKLALFLLLGYVLLVCDTHLMETFGLLYNWQAGAVNFAVIISLIHYSLTLLVLLNKYLQE